MAEFLEAGDAKTKQNPLGMVAACRETGRLLGLYLVARTAVHVDVAQVLNNPLERMSDEAVALLAARPSQATSFAV